MCKAKERQKAHPGIYIKPENHSLRGDVEDCKGILAGQDVPAISQPAQEGKDVNKASRVHQRPCLAL